MLLSAKRWAKRWSARAAETGLKNQSK